MSNVLTSAAAPDQEQGPRRSLRDSRLGTVVVLAVTALLVIGGVSLVDRPSTSSTTTRTATKDDAGAPRVGAPAQDFTATTVDGTTISLAGLKGHPVWLTFGASWCAACQAEAPDVEAAYEKYARQGVVVLDVSISEDASAAKDYAQRIGLTFPVVADPNSSIADAYRVSAIPAHFFIDKAGVIRVMTPGGLSPEAMAADITTITR